jgi:hypothetical protein
MDPNRANLVTPSLIELLKKMEPLDTLILEQLVVGRDVLPSVPSNDLAESLAKKRNPRHESDTGNQICGPR